MNIFYVLTALTVLTILLLFHIQLTAVLKKQLTSLVKHKNNQSKTNHPLLPKNPFAENLNWSGN